MAKTKIMTQRALDAMRPDKERCDRPDGIVPGLRFDIHPTGKKSSRLLARVHGKLKSFPIGDMSMMTVAEARAKAKGILAAIASGEDPSETKRAVARNAAEIVELVSRNFIERYAKAHNKTWQETERLIARNILPSWGRRPIASIDRRDVNDLLDAIVDRDAPIAANRVFAAGRKLFAWARARDLIATSPFEGVKAPSKEISRDRTPSDFELGLSLQAAVKIGFPFGTFVTLLAFLGQRRAEVAGLRWSELNSDLTLWTLPRERAKNNVQHEVPIAPEVRSILVALPRFEGSDFVLTSSGTTSISGYSKAKSALDSAITELNGGTPIEPWRLHDLRRSMASGMAKLGVQLPVVEKILNHVSGSFAGVAGVYQRHDFADEKRRALEIWAQYLLTLETGGEAANVVRRGLKAHAT